VRRKDLLKSALFQFATNAVGKVPAVFENMLVLYLVNSMERAMNIEVIDLTPRAFEGEIISLTQVLEETEVREATELIGADFAVWGNLSFEPDGEPVITGCDIEMDLLATGRSQASRKFHFSGLKGDLKSAGLAIDIPSLEDTVEEMLLAVTDFLELDPETMDFEKIGEGLTNSEKALTYFVYALRIAEEPESKLRLYMKAIAGDPYFASAYINCAQLLIGEGRYGEAMRILLRGEANLKGSSLEADILNLLGVATMNMGMWDEAVKVWERALESREDYVEVLCNLGSAFAMKDMTEEAETYYRLAVSFRDDFPLAWFSLGRLLANDDRCDEAEQPIRRYIELRPGDPWAYYILGSCLLTLGKEDEAVFALGKAAQLDPDGEAGNLARAELHQLRG
jgi:tetratricopeptide (TPR) repeat protein